MIEHDGKKIPTADPKDPNSIDVEYGFTYSLIPLEVITSSSWLVNDVAITIGETLDGIRLDSSGYLDNVTKSGWSLGNPDDKYKITNRLGTSVTPSDDRSMYFKIKPL